MRQKNIGKLNAPQWKNNIVSNDGKGLKVGWNDHRPALGVSWDVNVYVLW